MRCINNIYILQSVSTAPNETRSNEPDRNDMLRQIKEGVSLKSAAVSMITKHYFQIKRVLNDDQFFRLLERIHMTI